MADPDLALYGDLFPAQWQISLMLQGDREGSARAAFFFSSKQGKLTKGAERILQIWIPGVSEPELEELFPMELQSRRSSQPRESGKDDKLGGELYFTG